MRLADAEVIALAERIHDGAKTSTQRCLVLAG